MSFKARSFWDIYFASHLPLWLFSLYLVKIIAVDGMQEAIVVLIFMYFFGFVVEFVVGITEGCLVARGIRYGKDHQSLNQGNRILLALFLGAMWAVIYLVGLLISSSEIGLHIWAKVLFPCFLLLGPSVLVLSPVAIAIEFSRYKHIYTLIITLGIICGGAVFLVFFLFEYFFRVWEHGLF